MNKIQWCPVEELDDTGEPRAVHIMPVVMTDGFDTKEEAERFLQSVEDAGAPCLTDEDGMIVATYFGHDLKPDCGCAPEFRGDSLTPTYIHRTTQ